MKKRAMKKWIPKGMYCYSYNKKCCKWFKKLKIKNKKIFKCEYMNFIDFNEDSLIWDSCKECGIKDYDSL